MDNKFESEREALLYIMRMLEKNQSKCDLEQKSIKDLRRLFDQRSSRMNCAILNNLSLDEIMKETKSTILALLYILLNNKR